VIASQAVLHPIGIDWTAGARCWRSSRHREAESSWAGFLLGLKARWSAWRRVCRHRRSAASERRCARLAKAAYRGCMCISCATRSTTCRARSTTIACKELRCYDRRDLIEARRDLAAWLAKWSAKYSKPHRLGSKTYIDETLTFLSAAAPAP